MCLSRPLPSLQSSLFMAAICCQRDQTTTANTPSSLSQWHYIPASLCPQLSLQKASCSLDFLLLSRYKNLMNINDTSTNRRKQWEPFVFILRVLPPASFAQICRFGCTFFLLWLICIVFLLYFVLFLWLLVLFNCVNASEREWWWTKTKASSL